MQKCRGESILVETSGGERRVLASDWTNAEKKETAPHKTPAHLLDYGGLRQIIEHIQYQKRDKTQICRSEKADYDEEHQSQSKSTPEEQNDPDNFRETDMRTAQDMGRIEPREPKRRDKSAGCAGVEANSSSTRKGGLR